MNFKMKTYDDVSMKGALEDIGFEDVLLTEDEYGEPVWEMLADGRFATAYLYPDGRLEIDSMCSNPEIPINWQLQLLALGYIPVGAKLSEFLPDDIKAKI